MKRLILSILACLLLAASAMAGEPVIATEHSVVGASAVVFPGSSTITLEDPWTQLARMSGPMLGSGGGAVATTWVYSAGGVSDYVDPGITTANSTIYLCQPITISSHNYSKLGIRISTIGSSTHLWVAIYGAGGTYIIGGHITNIAIGWNDIMIDSTALNGEYKICYQSNSNDMYISTYLTSIVTKYSVQNPYSDTPAEWAALSAWGTTYALGLRVGY